MSELSESSPRPGVGRALLWTAAAVPLPGIAHLRAGRRRSGLLILGVFLVLIAGGVAAGLMLADDLARGARLATRPQWLIGGAATAAAMALLWMTVVIHSYVVLRPAGGGWLKRGGALVVVGALCLAIAAPAAAVVRTSYIAHDRLTSIFGSEPDSPAAEGGEGGSEATAPWGGRDRVSVLLIGSDGAEERYGTRTDSIMVANVDVEHGDVVLIGLPRNLQNVPFPEGTELAERYPEPSGFNELLTDVYQRVDEEPEELAINPRADNPAADTLRQTVGHAIGLDIDYYAMVDMRGFRDLIDAIGGVTVRIEDPIPWGHQGDVLEPGLQTLTGRQSLWYVRSRINSDDYTRMGRQGCLIKAVAEQADPWTVATSFQDVANAAEHTLETDIPLSMVEHFIDVAELVSDGTMRTLQLSPPQVNTAYPDWEEVREIVGDAVQEQEDAQLNSPEPGEPDPGPEGSPDPSAADDSEVEGDSADTTGAEGEEEQDGDGSSEWQEWSGSPSPSPTTPGRQVGDDPESLDALCP